MISLDPYILEFIANNTVTIGMLFALLKGVARITKNVEDDKIVTLVELVFGQIPTSTTLPKAKK